MYSQIDSNRHKTWILIACSTGILALAGWAFGNYYSQDGYTGLIFALCISLGMTLISWFAGDSIALSSCGAMELKDRSQFPTLWNLVENLSITAGIPRPRIYITQEQAPNAFATGRDPAHASICVTTGLLERLNKVELEGVLAHELSHIKNYDIRIMMLAVVLVGALTLLGDWFLRGALFGGSRRERDRDNSGAGNIVMIISIVILVLSPIIGQLMRMAVSRRREYLADASAALLTRYPEGLASALEKIKDAAIPMKHTSTATNHLWISEPRVRSLGHTLSNLFATHPPIEERIKQLRGMIDTP